MEKSRGNTGKYRGKRQDGGGYGNFADKRPAGNGAGYREDKFRGGNAAGKPDYRKPEGSGSGRYADKRPGGYNAGRYSEKRSAEDVSGRPAYRKPDGNSAGRFSDDRAAANGSDSGRSDYRRRLGNNSGNSGGGKKSGGDAPGYWNKGESRGKKPAGDNYTFNRSSKNWPGYANDSRPHDNAGDDGGSFRKETRGYSRSNNGAGRANSTLADRQLRGGASDFSDDGGFNGGFQKEPAPGKKPYNKEKRGYPKADNGETRAYKPKTGRQFDNRTPNYSKKDGFTPKYTEEGRPYKKETRGYDDAFNEEPREGQETRESRAAAPVYDRPYEGGAKDYSKGEFSGKGGFRKNSAVGGGSHKKNMPKYSSNYSNNDNDKNEYRKSATSDRLSDDSPKAVVAHPENNASENAAAASGDADILRLEGRNAVLEALNHGQPIDKILVRKDAGAAPSGTLKVIIAKARERGVVVQEVVKARLDELSSGGNHQGVMALCPAKEYVEPEDILNAARSKGEDPFVVILDGITDPHNLGAIIRSAEAAGAHGIILPKRRAVGLTDVVARTSAGAIELMPVSRVTNLGDTMEWLKKNGLWIACADMAGKSMYSANLRGPLALVIGSEGDGAGRLVREKCDFSVSIPMLGKIASLNASVAAGVLFYEVVRQRGLNQISGTTDMM